MNYSSRASKEARLFCFQAVLIKMLRLFICHVSEDKEDFVEPLAVELGKEFDVWYDKFQLTLGDSLLQKITEGLLAADFGVVVLSKAFFKKKKWAENELAALFALETTTRKIVLPIWKDVTEADVKDYSPILANRFAVSASQGIEKVVGEIKIAVNVAQRKDEITRDVATGKVRALIQTLAQQKEAERLAYSEQGAELVSASVTHLFNEIERIIQSGVGESSAVKFGFGRPMPHILYVNTIRGMYLGLGLRDFFSNSVAHALLEAKIFQRHFGAFGGPESSGTDIEQFNFKPNFRDGKVIWIADEENKRAFPAGDLAVHLVERYIEHVAEQATIT
jgi:hypothetical protein